MREPRDPLLKVVYNFYRYKKDLIQHSKQIHWFVKNDIDLAGWPRWHKPEQVYNACTVGETKMTSVHMPPGELATACSSLFVNDPSAGSPTETLLRLLLPLNDQV